MSLALAQDREGAVEEEPTADQVIERLVEHYGSLDALTCKARSVRQSEVDGRSQTRAVTFTTSLEVPNLALLLPEERAASAWLACDGEELRTYSPSVREFTVREAPESFEELAAMSSDLDHVSTLAETPLEVILRLMSDDSRTWLTEDTIEIETVGLEQVRGQDAVRVRFARDKPSRRSPRMAVDLVVAWGGEPWVLRYEPDYSVFYRDRPGLGVSHAVEYSNWSTDEPDAFRMALPENARRVDEFDTSTWMEKKPTEMIGDPAQRFFLPDLDGDTSELAALIDDGPVVLEFWNSWCEASRQAFPALRRTREAAAEMNATVVSILDSESETDVKAFREQFPEMASTAVLDATGVVTRRYHHMRNPTIVAVDRSGRISFVKSGVANADLDELVRSLRKALQ